MDGGNWTEILSDKYFGSNDPYTGVVCVWCGSGSGGSGGSGGGSIGGSGRDGRSGCSGGVV